MTTHLREIIERLEREPRDKPVPIGFGKPHSDRGNYMDLSFTPVLNTTVGEMLDCARSCIGATFEGWKGGDFKMGEYSTVTYAYDGACGDALGLLLLEYMLGGDPMSQLPRDYA